VLTAMPGQAGPAISPHTSIANTYYATADLTGPPVGFFEFGTCGTASSGIRTSFLTEQFITC
jgi:hypothetical protein